MLDIFDELKSVVTSLNENNLEYALCGGLAMAVHSIPRATIDIDILILSSDIVRIIMTFENSENNRVNLDMSSKAITTRLRRVSQLRRLCLSLGQAGDNNKKINRV